MLVPIDEIRKVLIEALLGKGLKDNEAEIVADEYLDGELEGKITHGLAAFPTLIDSLDSSLPDPEIESETESTLVINAHKNLGSLLVEKYKNQLISKARKQGIALLTVKDMTTWLRPGWIAKKFAAENLIALVFNNGGKPMIAPPDGFDPVIGTNPIGYAVPTDQNPVVADMATSKTAWGEVRKAQEAHRNLPQETFLTDTGSYAVDPKDAYSVVATGKHKGFSLALLIEILTGSMLGRPMGATQMTDDYRVMSRGGIIILIDPSHFTQLDLFTKSNTELVSNIKNSHKISANQEILLPGDRANKNKEENEIKGVLEVKEELWEKLKNHAAN